LKIGKLPNSCALMASKEKQLRALEARQTEEGRNNDETWQSEAK
jgi:hypothetical protein